MGSKIIIVDENDKVIVNKDRERLKPEDIYRVSALWISNGKDKVLLAKRALSKKSFPGCWGPAVSGTVQEGETYYSNVIKEAREELGLKEIIPTKGPKVRVASDDYNYFTQWYLLTVEEGQARLKLNKKEVSELKWLGKSNLKRDVKSKPSNFTHVMDKWVKIFC